MNKVFRNKHQLLVALNKLSKSQINVKKSLLAPKFGYFLTSGKYLNCHSVTMLLSSFNLEFGNIIGKDSRVIGGITVLQLPDDFEIDTEELPTMDKDTAIAFGLGDDLKKAKVDLEEYARRYGIELNRRLSFDNMIQQLFDSV